MAKLNRKSPISRATALTHEGAKAYSDNPARELRRAVLCCLLWEDTFYESGEDIANRILKLIDKVPPSQVATLAVEARTKYHLRHVPLLLVAALAKSGKCSGTSLISDTIEAVVQRPDEMGELLAIYKKLNGKRVPIANQITKGLARVFGRFTQYQFAKYNRKGEEYSLRDVMFKVHPKPRDEAQIALYNMLANDTLPPPDTWEVELSAGKDKKETFTRLLTENKLGYLALLRNLRNMEQSGVNFNLVSKAIRARKGGADKLLPFRYIAAYRAAPKYQEALNDALLEGLANLPRLDGHTAIYIDVSGSMQAGISGKSDLTRADVAAALGAVFPGEEVTTYFFDDSVKSVKSYGRGLNAVDRLKRNGGGTNFQALFEHISKQKNVHRVIVITDEQSQTTPTTRVKKIGEYRYMINVGGYQNSIVSDAEWTRIDGFSENIFRFISEWEKHNGR